MRAVLQAIADELQRLKADGESTVAVSDETLAGLRAMVRARGGGSAPVRPAVNDSSAPSPSRLSREAVAPEAARTPDAAFTLRGLAKGEVIGDVPPPPAVALPEGDKAGRWAALRAVIEADAVCAARLGPGVRPFFGAGSLDARIVFVADAPNEEEERSGSPLLGASGELLARMIGAMGLKPEAVFVTTLLPWRPQTMGAGGVSADRAPRPAELAYGTAFFRALLGIIQPTVVVALGNEAAQALRTEKINNLAEARGQWSEFAGRAVMVTCKPGYLILSGTKRSKRLAWEELLKVMEREGLPISEKQKGYFL